MPAINQKQIGIDARRATKAGRFYEVGDDSYPSVTTILSVIGKPALINWAAKVERVAVVEAAANLYEDIHGTPKMSRPVFVTTLEARIGKQKAATKELEKAGEIGTQTHAIIEWNIRKNLGQKVGPEPKIQEKALWAFMSFEDWAKRVSLKPVRIEQVLFSTKYGYAGTMDLLAHVTLTQSDIPDGMDLKSGTYLALIDFKTGKAVYREAYQQTAAYKNALIEMGHEKAEVCMIVRLPKIETDPEFETVIIPDPDSHFQAFLHTFELWKWVQIGEREYQEKIRAAKESAA
jgi:hypothetical protein